MLGKRNGTQRKIITSGIEHSTNFFTRVFDMFSSCQKLFRVVVPLYSKLRRMALQKQLKELQEMRSKFTVYLNGDACP